MIKRLPVLLALFVAALVLAACGGSDPAEPKASGGSSKAIEVGEPVVDGAPLAPAPESGEDPAIGAEVPQVSSVDFTGTDVELLTDGRPAVVLVAAHWCPHCQADVDALRAFFADGGSFADGVDFVVLHTWPAPERGNWPASAWLDGLGDRVLLDDAPGTAATALGLTATPMWLAVNAEGEVTERAVGNVAPETVASWTEELATEPAA